MARLLYFILAAIQLPLQFLLVPVQTVDLSPQVGAQLGHDIVNVALVALLLQQNLQFGLKPFVFLLQVAHL